MLRHCMVCYRKTYTLGRLTNTKKTAKNQITAKVTIANQRKRAESWDAHPFNYAGTPDTFHMCVQATARQDGRLICCQYCHVLAY